jgi:hypothetical protein
MFGERLPIGNVLLSNGRVTNDQQILGVPLLGSFGEIETAGNHGKTVNDDHLVVSNCMVVVDQWYDPGVARKVTAEYLSVSLSESRITEIWTPRRLSSSRALAIRSDVKL